MRKAIAIGLCGMLAIGSVASLAGCGNKEQQTSTQPTQGAQATLDGNQGGNEKLNQLELSEASKGAYIKNNGKYFLGTAEDMRTMLNAKTDKDMAKIGKLSLDGDKYWYNKDSSYDAVTAAFVLDDSKEHIQVVNFAFPYPKNDQDKSIEIESAICHILAKFMRVINEDNQPLFDKVYSSLLRNEDGDFVFERGKAKTIIAQGIYYSLKVDQNTNVMVLTILPTERADESWEENI